MYLIVVIAQSDKIMVKGHANYAEPGKDIVCAGVSTMVQTLIRAIEELTEDKIEYGILPGTAYIKSGNLSEKAQTLVDSFFIGIRMISDEYPECVRVIK